MKKKLVVFTGAGISAESGISTFRGTDGLWEGRRIEEVASPEGWKRNPELVLDFYNRRRRQLLGVEPNEAHRLLAALEEKFDTWIITQNVDDLHERSGSTQVIHLHGELRKSRSSYDESVIYDCDTDILLGDTCELGSQLRPHIVWFGEMVPRMDDAIRITRQADVFIVIGSSLVVYPAASLIHHTRKEVPKFLIDLNIPDFPGIENITCIQDKATSGVATWIQTWTS